MIHDIILVILSFFASVGFAIVFHMRRDFLFFAGLGGALTRVVCLLAMSYTDNRSIYVFISAMFASLYAYYMSGKKYTPSTVFLYPSIIPLIPGDLLYFTIEALIHLNWTEFALNGLNLMIALIWMGFGFVVAISFMYYYRKVKNINPLDLLR